MTYEELADAIRSSNDLSELERLVGPSNDVLQASLNRLAQLDAIAPRCKFDVAGYVDYDTQMARERYKRIEREQDEFESTYL